VFVLLVGCFLLATGAWLSYRPRREEPLPVPPPEITAGPPRVVTVGLPVEREITDYEEFTGRTEPSASVEVRPRVSGTLAKVHHEAGTVVGKGDPLFDLDPNPFRAALEKAEAEVKRLEERHKQSLAEYGRAEKRREAREIDQKELDKARENLERDEQALLAARTTLTRARLDLDSARVAAPIDGRIGRTVVPEGSQVTANVTVLTTLETLDPMAVRFPVDQTALLRIRERRHETGTRTEGCPLLLGLADDEGFPHRGTVAFVESAPPGRAREVTVRGTFPNADRALRPGQEVWLRLPLGAPYRALLVSDAAVLHEGKQDYLLVVNDHNRVESRTVRLGQLYEGWRVVREGLTSRDAVVVTGTQRVQPGDTVDPRRAPMPAPAPIKRKKEEG
jgi:RND family efflux transporter MFP subunit